MKVTLTECTINPVLSVERAAANCYDSNPSSGRIMRSCYTSGHHSVLEFADFTFHIEGISRACSHQLVRHRCASYAQRSQRYCKEDGFGFVEPKTIKDNDDASVEYQHFMDRCQLTYNYLIEHGIPEEDARMVLPNACETVIEVKMNGRELIHFMNERLCTRAQWEIRELAKQMKKVVAEYNDECAEFSKFFVPKCYSNPKYPFCTEHNSCGIAPKLKDVYNVYLSSKGEVNE
ncbi:MAG: FAD-dependent thymidylate synthase [Candidatus Kurthia intestinigallinarum]